VLLYTTLVFHYPLCCNSRL